MSQSHCKFYFPLDEYKDHRKKEFVACRMERSLFLDLTKRAQAEGKELSEKIRELCREGLKGESHGF